MRAALAAVALVLTLAAVAGAQETQRARLITEIDADAFSDHFPVVALATAVSGRVVLECAVAVDGSSECRTTEETPVGAGFGAAAEAFAADWRFSPRMENGRPVASVARVPVVFENPNNRRSVLLGRIRVDGVRGANNSASANWDDAPPQAWMDSTTCHWGGGTQCAEGAQRDGAVNARYYPEQALIQNIEGEAIVACVVRSTQRVDCAAGTETPAQSGFGERAATLIGDIVARASQPIPADTVFRVVVNFALYDAGEAPSPARSVWRMRPTGEDFERYYPRDAMQRRIDGRVRLFCEILPIGRLACITGEETPADMGFGAAAVAISQGFQLHDWALDQAGYAVGERIVVPIQFRIR